MFDVCFVISITIVVKQGATPVGNNEKRNKQEID